EVLDAFLTSRLGKSNRHANQVSPGLNFVALLMSQRAGMLQDFVRIEDRFRHRLSPFRFTPTGRRRIDSSPFVSSERASAWLGDLSPTTCAWRRSRGAATESAYPRVLAESVACAKSARQLVRSLRVLIQSVCQRVL